MTLLCPWLTVLEGFHYNDSRPGMNIQSVCQCEILKRMIQSGAKALK